jgi:CheY-like chemotaxis protein
MPTVLIAGREILVKELAGSPVWRDGLDRVIAHDVKEAATMVVAAKPSLVVVDRDMARAEYLIQSLRGDPGTQKTSIVIVAAGPMQHEELGLLSAGANALLRLPPSPDWDTCIERLLSVPTRKQTRVGVAIAFEASFGTEHVEGQILNLSLTGMLVECPAQLGIGDELQFGFHLHGFETSTGEIRGGARVVRFAGARRYGAEFLSFAESGKELLRRFLLLP